MTAERDTTRIVRSWLRAHEHESADRVLFSVLARLDTTPQRRSWWPARRPNALSNPIRLALAAAAVVLAIVGLRFLPAAPSTGNPTTAPTAQATASPTLVRTPSPAVEKLHDGDLASGRYRLTVPRSDVEAIVTVGDGWSGSGAGPSTDSWYINSPKYGSISFWTVGNVGTDACDPFGTVPDPAVGATVDEFVSALGAQQNSDTTRPQAVSVGRLLGQRLEIRPSETADCDQTTWWVVSSQERGRGADRGERTPDVLYAVDVEGQLVVVAAYILGQQEVFNDIIASLDLKRG